MVYIALISPFDLSYNRPQSVHCSAGGADVKLLPLPQPPLRARMDARTNPSAQRATQLNQTTTTVS
jgi:hypothetical protein